MLLIFYIINLLNKSKTSIVFEKISFFAILGINFVPKKWHLFLITFYAFALEGLLYNEKKFFQLNQSNRFGKITENWKLLLSFFLNMSKLSMEDEKKQELLLQWWYRHSLEPVWAN